MKRRKPRKRGRNRPVTLPSGVRPLDAVLMSGIGVLVAIGLGASPETALQYAVQSLRLLGAKEVTVEDGNDEYQNWLDGLA